MHTIGNALLKAGVECVASQTAKAILEEPGKNRDDLRQRQLNASFAQGITDIKSKLDGIARKDVLASISFFNEGCVYLCRVLNEASVTGVNARLPTLADASTPGSETPSAAWLETISLIKALKSDLDDSAISMLSDAKERFKDARRKATKAFCNEALSVGERIFAMRCRAAATLFEKVDNPAEALVACKLCLEELNSMPAVKENFGRKRSEESETEVHKEVCDINSVICDVTQLFGNGVGELLNWPCVTIRNGAKIDPLHNARMEHCCLTWLFGQEGEEEHKLKFAWGITSNTRGDFIVADSVDRNVKVFDGSGRFLRSLYPFAEDLQSKDEYEVWNITSDGNDDLYVLALRRNEFPMANWSEVRVFNKDGHRKRKFALREGFRGSSIAVDDNSRVFVTGGALSGCLNDAIEVYSTGGVFMHGFGNEHLKNAQDITIVNDNRVVVLDGEKNPLALVFSTEGQLLERFTVNGSTADDSGVAVTFHKASKTVLVASLQSETSIQVYMYSEDGQFVRRVRFKTKGCRFITGITTNVKGRIAVPDRNKNNKDKCMFLLYLHANAVNNNKGAGPSSGDQQTSGLAMEFSIKELYAIQEIQAQRNLFRLIVGSLCPSIYGHEMVKAGLVLGLFGGTQRYLNDKNRIPVRGNPHILVVGDPGLGKSQMLQAVSNIAPRGVYVCGNATSSSGLTVTLSKESSSGDYSLEAGALVLGDQGCCCIDEFDKMGSQHQALLEAMEQQSISIAKAGIVCSLPARTSILAAANPVGGHYNKAKTVSENLKMGSALLSRFDLVFILLDKPDEEMDCMLSEHVMALHSGKKSAFGIATARRRTREESDSDEDEMRRQWEADKPLSERLKIGRNEEFDAIPGPLLRKYVGYARTYVNPKLTPAAAEVLQNFYLDLRRQHHSADSTPITTRQLESLIRLTQARARLEMREKASRQDAQDVVEIMKYSLLDTFSDDFGNLDFQRSQHGSGMSSRAQSKRFVAELSRVSEREYNSLFTIEQMRRIAKDLRLQIRSFDDFVYSLNNQGFLLKKGPRVYQLQTSNCL